MTSVEGAIHNSAENNNNNNHNKLQDVNSTTQKLEEDPDVSEMERLLAQEEEEEEEEEEAHNNRNHVNVNENVNANVDLDDNVIHNANANDHGHANDRIDGEEIQNDAAPNINNNNNNNNEEHVQDEVHFHDHDHANINANANLNPNRLAGLNSINTRPSFLKSNYTTISITITILHLLYVLRTRKQVYLALMFLTTSRISYILIGNAIISCFVSLYHYVIKIFLGGLRLTESESIGESIRWNITESIFALTMFRQEVSVKMMGMFCIVFWLKCLHWAVELRGSHLRMTEEFFYFLDDGDILYSNSLNLGSSTTRNVSEGSTDSNSNSNTITTTWAKAGWNMITSFLPQSVKKRCAKMYDEAPRIRKTHLMYYMLMNILYTLDIGLIAYCSGELIESGPSSVILFLFEASIMMITILSSEFLFTMHIFDGFINVFQRLASHDNDNEEEGDHSEVQEDVNADVAAVADGDAVQEGEENLQHDHNRQNVSVTGTTTSTTIVESRHRIFIMRLASMWRDNRATATFSVELMALSAKFLFHFMLFAVIFVTYGLPISIIRDFYIAYLKLHRRLSAFVSYRRLTSNMDKRFKTVDTEEELDEVGRTCIICRDMMDIHGIHGVVKRLPCGHAFHKHCLREWLVQQQSCPTCRGDIQANEARVAREEAEMRAREALDDEESVEEVDQDDENDDTDENGSDDSDDNDNELNNTKEKEDLNQEQNVSEYPILCKVINKVPVVDFSTSINSSGKEDVCQHLKRVANEGTLVVCTEMKVWVWNKLDNTCCIATGGDTGSDNDDNNCQNIVNEKCIPNEVGAGVFFKVPDGWIKQNEVVKLLVLKQKIA